MKVFDLVVIGAGVSGLTAAIEAKIRGAQDVIIIEREEEPGGAINCCVHTGFYYKNIKENLTIPELISKLIKEAQSLGIIIKCETTVLEIEKSKNVTLVNSDEGITTIEGKVIILAMGSREIPFGYKNILGYGKEGITTAYSTLRYINKKGVMPGKKCIILGSDDIGVLAAKTLILEGATVNSMIETNNKVRAINEQSSYYIQDFNIPVLFKHRVVKIYGTSRVSGVDIVHIDDDYNVIEGTCKYMECDTLVLCMNLKPDTVIAKKMGIQINDENSGIIASEYMETSIPGIFACGTVITGYNSVENVMNQGRIAGKYAIEYWREHGC
ncbi:MAG: NAD(P)/FAD-dependent oxidoreductase [Clostridium sp.]|uniref:NAD(P)/FAD-dependent oxidoreductase n=1 Tax=Clostridium sp. TaxID=1506 RepID=UPI00306E1531